MSSTTHFLSFSPSKRLPSRSIAFQSSDRLQLTLGGTYSRPYSDSRPSLQDSPFLFEESTIANDQATILCAGGNIILTHQDRDGTTRINGRPLDRDQRVLLHHGDQIDLGYYEPMDDEYTFNLFLRVDITSTPPVLAISRARLTTSDELLPTTRSVLHASLALQEAMTQLSEELAKTRKQLQDALDREAAHTCFPPSPPRSYGSLLADLRVRAEESDSSPSARPSRSLAPSSASDSPSTSCSSSSLNDYQPSSTRSRSVTASPSVTTSVLTSVLRTEAAPSSTATLSAESTPPSPPSSITASASNSTDGTRCRKTTLAGNLSSRIGTTAVAAVAALSLTSAIKAVETIRGAWLQERASVFRTSHSTPDGTVQQASCSIQVALHRVQQAWTDVRAPVVAATCFPAANFGSSSARFSMPAGLPYPPSPSSSGLDHSTGSFSSSSSHPSHQTSSSFTPPVSPFRTSTSPTILSSSFSDAATQLQSRSNVWLRDVLNELVNLLAASANHEFRFQRINRPTALPSFPLIGSHLQGCYLPPPSTPTCAF